MIVFAWNEEKNRWLKQMRNISFDDIVRAYTAGRILDITPNPNQLKYGNQKVFFVYIRKYVYMVPFIDEGDRLFLKTIIPTRKYLKQYKELIRKEQYEKK